MTFEQLLYTLELAKHRTLGEAADVLHISKSGLSQTISQLEAELNTTIFERTHDGTSLTVAGEKMLPTIQKILSGKNDMMNEAMVSGQTAYEQVKIAYSNTMIKAIPEAFFKIAQTNVKSNLRLDIVQKATHQIIEEVKNEKLDAGFITINNPNLKQISQLKFDIVHTSKVKLTVNKNNPLCNQKSISLEQLAKQKFGLYTDEYNDQLFKQLQYLCGPLNVVLRTDSGWTMLKAISDMNIVCLGREWQGNNSPDMPDNSDVLIRQLDLGNIINDEFVVGWITRPDYRKSPLLGSLITQVNQNLRA